MICLTCEFYRTYQPGSFQLVAEGAADPYIYHRCVRGHWEQGGHIEEEGPDPWKDCRDYLTNPATPPRDVYGKILRNRDALIRNNIEAAYQRYMALLIRGSQYPIEEYEKETS